VTKYLVKMDVRVRANSSKDFCQTTIISLKALITGATVECNGGSVDVITILIVVVLVDVVDVILDVIVAVVVDRNLPSKKILICCNVFSPKPQHNEIFDSLNN